jgi:xanthine dehydrogenase accessory factor
MNEISQLRNAAEAARESGEGHALATIVRVEGSAYRRPGARMLITAGGRTTGLISGGCLDSDVRERALQVIESGRPALVRYDTSKEEDLVWGLGLGCNGVVDVLIEPGTDRVTALLRGLDVAQSGEGRSVVVSVIRSDVAELPPGVSMLLSRDATISLPPSRTVDNIVARLRDDAEAAFQSGVSRIARHGAGGEVEAFIEVVEPRVPLVIFGAGADVIPLVDWARHLGWHTTVVDTHAREKSTERFAHADAVILCAPEDVARLVTLTGASAVVLMTHSYTHDLQLLPMLLNSTARYLGCLGPRRRTDRLLSELGDAVPGGSGLDRLHAPIGLDLGAESPSEIAMAIVAEVLASIKVRSGHSLRHSRGSIHGGGLPTPEHDEQRAAPSRSAAHVRAAVTA